MKANQVLLQCAMQGFQTDFLVGSADATPEVEVTAFFNDLNGRYFLERNIRSLMDDGDILETKVKEEGESVYWGWVTYKKIFE